MKLSLHLWRIYRHPFVYILFLCIFILLIYFQLLAFEDKKAHVDLLIIIPSSPHERALRDAIRNSWLKYGYNDVLGNHFKHYFVIGTNKLDDGVLEYLETEMNLHEDLLLLRNVSDSYNTLSQKILQAFVSIGDANRFSEFSFVLKTDSDSFVNVPGLLKRLRENDVADIQYAYLGFFIGNGPVFRKGKWAEFSWDSCVHYTPYAAGGGYILSRKSVQYIAKNAGILRIFNNEDVTVGFWFSAVNVKRIHDRRFDTEYKSRGCSNKYLVTHPHSMENIQLMTELATKSQGRQICLKESVLMYSYEYRWNGNPLNCCNRTLKF